MKTLRRVYWVSSLIGLSVVLASLLIAPTQQRTLERDVWGGQNCGQQCYFKDGVDTKCHLFPNETEETCAKIECPQATPRKCPFPKVRRFNEDDMRRQVEFKAACKPPTGSGNCPEVDEHGSAATQTTSTAVDCFKVEYCRTEDDTCVWNGMKWICDTASTAEEEPESHVDPDKEHFACPNCN